MEPGFDRTQGYLQESRDFGLREVVHVVQQQYAALRLWQGVNRGSDVVGQLPAFRRRIGQRDLPHLLQRHQLRPLHTQAAVGARMHDTPEPARESRGIAQAEQAIPSGDESFLRGVFRLLPVAQLRVSISHRHILEAAHHFFVGIAIPLAGGDDQSGQIFHRLSFGYAFKLKSRFGV